MMDNRSDNSDALFLVEIPTPRVRFPYPAWTYDGFLYSQIGRKNLNIFGL